MKTLLQAAATLERQFFVGGGGETSVFPTNQATMIFTMPFIKGQTFVLCQQVRHLHAK